ncbi:MAG: hypothetical protein IPH42_20615 [Bacteroidetes bacterium]|nr:hypothetical protein [Bacteroidota bacterium]
MRNTEFRGYLQSVVGNKKELKLFINPDFQYYGQVDLSSFEITENDTTFGNTSDAKLTGIVIELEDKIEIQIESLFIRCTRVFIRHCRNYYAYPWAL